MASSTRSAGLGENATGVGSIAWSGATNIYTSNNNVANGTIWIAGSKGPVAPGTRANDATAGNVAWTNANNIATSNDSYATCTLTAGQTSQYLKATNFNLGLPSNATILGIEVSIERKAGGANTIYDHTVQLVVAGVISGTNKSAGADWPTTEASATFGGAADLWGLTPTQSQVSATNFGVVIRCSEGGAGGTASVDYVTLKVYYDASGGTNYLKATTFGFSIPDGATINGVEALFERRSYSTGTAIIKDSVVKLVKGGAISGDNKSAGATWATSDTVDTFGGASDLWGTTLTAANVNATDFGVVLAVITDGNANFTNAAYVDHVQMTVHYTEAPPAATTAKDRLLLGVG